MADGALPSIGMAARTPCQHSAVGSSRPLTNRTRTSSPRRARITGPGAAPLKPSLPACSTVTPGASPAQARAAIAARAQPEQTRRWRRDSMAPGYIARHLDGANGPGLSGPSEALGLGARRRLADGKTPRNPGDAQPDTRLSRQFSLEYLSRNPDRRRRQ